MATSTLQWDPVIELKTCVYHIYAQDFNHSMPKVVFFVIVPLIAGFVLLQIFTGKPNNSTFRTKNLACFLLWLFFLCFFLSYFFFPPHHSLKPADRVRSRLILHIWSSWGLMLQESKLFEGFHHSWGSCAECICVVRGFWLRKKKVQLPDLCTCSSSLLEAKSFRLH